MHLTLKLRALRALCESPGIKPMFRPCLVPTHSGNDSSISQTYSQRGPLRQAYQGHNVIPGRSSTTPDRWISSAQTVQPQVEFEAEEVETGEVGAGEVDMQYVTAHRIGPVEAVTEQKFIQYHMDESSE